MGNVDLDILNIDKNSDGRKKNRLKKDRTTAVMVAAGCVAACALILAVSIGLYKWVTEDSSREAANLETPEVIMYTQEEMEERAAQLGANAVVGVDIDYEVLGADNGMLMVTASGTAVRYE